MNDKELNDEDSVAQVLRYIAIVEVIIACIAGVIIGQQNYLDGLVIFISGFFGGLLLLGFSRIILYLQRSSRYLREIEILLRKNN